MSISYYSIVEVAFREAPKVVSHVNRLIRNRINGKQGRRSEFSQGCTNIEHGLFLIENLIDKSKAKWLDVATAGWRNMFLASHACQELERLLLEAKVAKAKMLEEKKQAKIAELGEEGYKALQEQRQKLVFDLICENEQHHDVRFEDYKHLLKD